MSQLFQAQLRTSDVEEACAFYAPLLPLDQLPPIVKLHEQAVARGARPHWLGFFEVADVDQATAAFTRRGGSSLAPKWLNPAGVEASVMRDPGGAVVALAKPPQPGAGSARPVAFSVLNTLDVELAKASYGELFGWHFAEPLELAEHGILHPFAWRAGEPAAGCMRDIRSRPGVHPHWLFQFRVASFEAALAAVRAGGGTLLAPTTLDSGERIVVCDDPQGAAFALRG